MAALTGQIEINFKPSVQGNDDSTFFDANAFRHHATLNQTENVPLIFPAFTACLSASVAIISDCPRAGRSTFGISESH